MINKIIAYLLFKLGFRYCWTMDTDYYTHYGYGKMDKFGNFKYPLNHKLVYGSKK